MDIYSIWASLLLAFIVIVIFIFIWQGATEIAEWLRGIFGKTIDWFKTKVR